MSGKEKHMTFNERKIQTEIKPNLVKLVGKTNASSNPEKQNMEHKCFFLIQFIQQDRSKKGSEKELTEYEIGIE